MIVYFYRNIHKVLLLLTCLFLAPVFTLNAQVIWSSPTGTSWLTAANWTGGVIPVAGQVAQFNANPTSATNGVGINMDTASGSYSVGAISLSSLRTNALIIGNSSPSTPGTLILTGATISSTANVILSNFAANTSRLTIQNIQGPGASTLAVNIGSGAKAILTGAGSSAALGNSINITTNISGAGSISFLGGGTWNATTSTGNNGGLLKLGGANTFSGGITVGSSDGTQSGVLELDTTGALSNIAGNDVTINSNSQLYLAAANNSSFPASNFTLHLNGSGNNSTTTGRGAMVNLGTFNYIWDGGIELATDAAINVAGAASTMTLSGNISGPGMLTKIGNGNLVLQGSLNSWTGGTTVTAGKITVSSGSGISSGPLSVNANGSSPSLTFNNGSQVISSLSSNSVTANTAVITLNGARLILNQAGNTTFGGNSSSNAATITGTGSVVKTGPGLITLTGLSNTFSGGLKISNGEWRLNPSSGTAVTNNSNDTLDGGTLSTTNISRSVTFTFGKLVLTNNSVIALGTDTTHSLKFASSSTTSWTSGKSLTIINWAGTWNGTAGTKGRVFVGSTAAGITASQLSQVKFQDGSGNIFNATILGTGELVPVAPSITTIVTPYGPFCSNISNPVSVSFTHSGPFTGAFLVQLSNASGIFTNDFTTNIIGSGSSSPITATIPVGMPAGTGYRIRVINASPVNTFGSDNGSNITILGAPVLPAISGPATIPLGSTVTLTDGTAGGTWSSGSPAVATVDAATGAVTGSATGTAVISYAYTNACGIAGYVTISVTVVPVPVITAVTPLHGIPGTTVIVSGADFNTTTSRNIVRFGAVKALVTSASATALSVVVPSGASFDKVTVTDSATREIAYSPAPFLPEYDNSGLMADSVNFKPIVNFNCGALPIGVAIGDLDGDGKPDMVVTNSGPNNLYVYRNTTPAGTINNSSFAAPATYATGPGPRYVKIADLDGDGRPEVIVANVGSGGKISVYKNASATGVIVLSTKIDIPAIAPPNDIAICDFNGDGKPDIVEVPQAGNNISVLINAINGGSITTTSFTEAALLSPGTSALPYRVTTGDFDNNGKPDIAVTCYSLSKIAVFRNTSTISQTSFAPAVFYNTGSSPTGLVNGDIDGDGLTDLLCTNTLSNTISVFRNTNTAAGTLSFTAAVPFTTGALPEDIVLSDVDGDNKPDVAVGNYNANTVSVYRNTATAGSITASSLSQPKNFATGNYPSGMAWNDLDGDDKPDLAIVSGNTSTVGILKNYPLPAIGTISGQDSICSGSAVTLTASVPGGTWISTNTSLATVSNTGVVYAVGAGMDTIIYYKVAQGDTNYVIFPVVTGNSPDVAPVSATSGSICAGAAALLTNTVAGGHWSSSNTGIASVDSNGLVTGISVGSAVISYSISSFCGSSFDTAVITVTPGTGYVIGAITGPGNVCQWTSVILNDTTPSGSWSVSNAAIATVTGSGNVTGIAYGSAVVTYALNTACGIYQAVHAVMVDTIPLSAAINGPATLCVGIPVTLSDAAGPGGTWSTSSAGNATITSAGIVTATVNGVDTIFYTLTNSCGSWSGSLDVFINPQPDAGTIIGASQVCSSDTIFLTSTFTGGMWSATNTFASVFSNGAVRGNAAGTDTIRYIAVNGCGADTALYTVTVLVAPVAGTITGSTSVCAGSAITLRDTVAGGIWSNVSGNTSVADSIITGVNAGTDTIKYTVTNACGTAVAIKKITINAVTPVDTIAGPSQVCTGAKITLTNATAGGTWSKTNNNATITTAGVVTGVTAGIDTIKYTPAGTCPMVATRQITINQAPATGTITGATSVCVGDTIVLRDTVAGGTWSGTNGATQVTDSFVTGIRPGADTVRYTITTAMCGMLSAIKKITVNPLPHAASITGSATMYVGDAVQLKDSTTGGAWSVKGANAVITAQGKVGALKAGIDTIRYSVTNSCGTAVALFPITILAASGQGTIAAIELYPNPGNGKFTLKLLSSVDENVKVLISGADFKIISLYDVTTNTDTSFDLSLPDGLYYLSALSDKGWFTTKFVIIN